MVAPRQVSKLAPKPVLKPVVAKPAGKVDKFAKLFLGGNPFAKAPKYSKTLIATPSKFEIRNAEPVKRGRGRPRKEEGSSPLKKALTAPLGVRGKLSKLKKSTTSVAAKKDTKQKLSAKSKKIDKVKLRKAFMRARKLALREKAARKKEEAKAKKQMLVVKREEKKAKLRALRGAKKQAKIQKMEKLKALIKQNKAKAKQRVAR